MFEKLILVVDDEPAICANLQALLEARGFKVITATDGREAVELARKDRPNLVLLDVKLPVLSGIEVCRCLKEDRSTKAIPVVMLTALDTLGDVERCFDAGADDYLNKPLDTPKLIEKLKAHL